MTSQVTLSPCCWVQKVRPDVGAHVRHLGPEDAGGRRVAVRDVDAGDLVVAVVVRRPARGVEGGRGVAALGEEADELGGPATGAAATQVDDVAGVQRVALPVQGVAGVLDDEQRVRGGEGDVVEPGVLLVAPGGERDRAAGRARALLRDPEHAAVGARQGAAGRGVTGLGDVELPEAGPGPEDAVLGALERGGPRGRGGRGRVDRRGPVGDVDPAGPERAAVGVQVGDEGVGRVGREPGRGHRGPVAAQDLETR